MDELSKKDREHENINIEHKPCSSFSPGFLMKFSFFKDCRGASRVMKF